MENEQYFDLSKVLNDLPLPPTKHGENIQSIRVKKITLIDKSGTDLRISVAARENDPSSSATTFFHSMEFNIQRGFKITSTEIEIFYCPNPGSRNVEVMTLQLFAKGASNLDDYICTEREMAKRFLEYWKILLPRATRDQSNSGLRLLGRTIEDRRSYIVPYRLSSAERISFEELRGTSIVEAKASPHGHQRFTCPICCDETITTAKLTCKYCGKIDIAQSEMHAYSPNYPQLITMIRKALSVKSDPPFKSIGENVWLVGVVGAGATQKKVLFVRQLSKPRGLKSLLENWGAYVGNSGVIIITTSGIHNMPIFIPGVQHQPQTFRFQDAFRFDEGKLIAESVLADAITPVPVGGHKWVNGPFTANFEFVRLEGETESIKLSQKRAKVFAFLWAQGGVKIKYEAILAVAKGEGKDAVESSLDAIFPKKNAPGPYKAFKSLVAHDKGEYWLKPEVFGITQT